MKKILGLDLGTNSIGWALIQQNSEDKKGNILGAGSRILPMSQDILGKFDSGQSISQTAERTGFRGVRRLRERHLLRRERLHRVLNILGFLPEHYGKYIDFEKRFGQFIPESEPKLPYTFNNATNRSDFIFKKSFDEMVQDFAKHQPQLLEDDKKIPYDWTIYYLRKKALTEKIEKEEIAWLLLNFNQKRGYYQLRGEDDEDATKTTETRTYFVTDIIESITDTGQVFKGLKVFRIKTLNGESGKYYNKTEPTWLGISKNIIVTVSTDKDGKDRFDDDGSVKRKFSIPTDDDWDKKWNLVKIKTEKEINDSNKTVGTYIYDSLLQSPKQKIKGKLVRVIERKFYKSELEEILIKQQEFHEELKDNNLYAICLEELYENNEAHRSNIGQKGFVHLFLNDIIFYQRPLKSKKSLISNCKFESRVFIKDGKKETEYLKCIAKSHPLFQEFRLWQFIQNLKIYEKETDKDITDEILKSEEDWISLFDWLNDRKEVDHKALLNYLLKPLKLKASNYRWNYVYDSVKDESKNYPCNETRAQILSRLAKIENIPTDFLTTENEVALWHILYSVEDINDIQKALKTFADKKGLADDFVEHFRKFPPFKKEYGAYSAKAIKKLLPLMRLGKYWNEENIDPKTKDRIDKILTGEYDETIRNRVREKSLSFNHINDFKGLPQWLTSYIVYDRHSEDGETKKWKTANEIELLSQHSLRNPIVEQVINETLQVVRDIWKQHGSGEENFFDEIHIELGREMKNPKKDRERMTNQINENENTNLRIKALLIELMNDGEVENVRPYSLMQQEILKIYEEGVLSAEDGNIPDDILKISKQSQPSSSELLKYTLWMQQKYRSPYTGAIIPLNKLFTREYDIEHIIPQSRYFDDSLSNKVICEMEVNKDKDNLLGYEYIKSNYGRTIELSGGKKVHLFTVDAYEKFVKDTYSKSRGKMSKLLMEDIPEAFIQRQLNDSRYISKVVKNLMSNIVREEGEQEAISKNVIASNGSITNTLKQDWGLNDVWNDIITPRFERLNELTNSKNFGDWTNKEGKRVFQTQIPLELAKGFSKKRIDHRHHALDAIVIACATRSHINYLNNESALGKEKKEIKEKKRYDLKHKLCVKKYNDDTKQNYKWIFHKPWDTFTQDAKETLYNIVVSFKQNLRVINKTVNHYQSWKDEKGNLRKDKNGNLQKGFVPQTKGENWAIRKSMHTPMPYGKKLYDYDVLKIADNVGKLEFVIDSEIKEQVISILEKHKNKITEAQKFLKNNPLNDKYGNKIIATAFKITTEKFRKRQPIFKLSNRGQGGIKTTDDALKFINKVANYKIRQDLLNHLRDNDNDIDKAFSPDGIDNFNVKRKIPVYKLPIAESGDKRFSLGEGKSTKHKWVEAAEGTNLFFAIYIDETGKRNYESIALNKVIEAQKQGSENKKKPEYCSVPETNEQGHILLFSLSPNDLVYVPNEEERANTNSIDFQNLSKEQVKGIYKVVSFSGTQCFFTRNDIAISIVNKFEFSPLNKMEKSIEEVMIKEFCRKIKIDRLGHITSIGNNLKVEGCVPVSAFSESHISYQQLPPDFKKLSVSTWKEQQNLNYKYSADLTPEERLAYLKELNDKAFGIKEYKPDADKNISFD